MAILETLAKELNVSVTELISGERSTSETIREQSDSALIETLLYVKRMGRKTLGTLLLIFGACMLCSPLFIAGSCAPILIMGVLVTVGGVLMLTLKRSFRIFNLPKSVLESVSLGAIAAALVLETLPNGVILWWAAPPGEPANCTFHAYFDPLPYGAAMFPPFITAILTVSVTIFTVIVLIFGIRSVKPRNALFVCLIVTAIISACPVLYGFKNVTVISILITLMLTLSAIFRAAANAKR